MKEDKIPHTKDVTVPVHIDRQLTYAHFQPKSFSLSYVFTLYSCMSKLTHRLFFLIP